MKRAGETSRATQEGESASERISKRIAQLDDWRGETLGRIRALIKQADPDIIEEWKWMGTPVWSHDGIVCTGESYKKVVKMTFAKAPLWRTLLASSTPASMGTCDGPSTSRRARRSTCLP
jgi:hypothetical protein